MRILSNCKICNSKNIRLSFQQKDKNFNLPENFSIFKCNRCNVLFPNPQPSSEDLKKYYPNEKYYSLKKIQSKEESKKTKLNLFLYKLYFDSKSKNKLMKIVFSPIKFIVRGTNIGRDKRILDIGSGSGQFLYEMKELGMETNGIEPEEFDKKGNKEYNLNIKKSNLLDIKYPKDSFDLITMNHVLEHINNPHETLREINRILKKKGIFIVAVPNTHSLAYWIFGKNWHQLDVPRHLFNYSDKNIKFLLKKNRFKILKIRYNSRPNQFVVSLYYLLGIRKRTGIFNRIFEIIFLPLTWLVNLLRIGDAIEVWCVKN